MWKDIALYGASSIFNYFYTQQLCDTNELMIMTCLNFVISVTTLCVVIMKSPIKVLDNRVDLK
jgi:hypothetical protein